MTRKSTCPNCESRTSAVYEAFVIGEPCPHCAYFNEIYPNLESLIDVLDQIEDRLFLVRRAVQEMKERAHSSEES